MILFEKVGCFSRGEDFIDDMEQEPGSHDDICVRRLEEIVSYVGMGICGCRGYEEFRVQGII